MKKTTNSRLRHRLSLQQEVQTADGAGGYVRTWQTIADLWAEFNYIRGKESLVAGQLQSEISHKVIIRYRAGVTAGSPNFAPFRQYLLEQLARTARFF